MSELTTTHRVRSALRRSRTLRRLVAAARHRGLRADDVFVASYPRSGNTWLRFVLADLATGSPANFEAVDRLIPYVGYHRDAPALAAGRRLIKTHEAYRSEYHRAIYLVRDCRDVLISWYRVTRSDPDDLSELDAAVRTFVTDRASPYGAWEDHVRQWRQAASRSPYILLRRFEDLRADPVAGLQEIIAFLGIEGSDSRVSEAVRRNDADTMRKLERESQGYLRAAFGYRSRGIRAGSGGDWRELLNSRHERVLEPALALNDQLGYPRT